ERHQAQHPTAEQAPPPKLDAPLKRDAIVATVQKVADWQWQHFKTGRDYGLREWTYAPFYIGLLAAADKMPTRGFQARMLAHAEQLGYQPHERIYHADDYAVLQAYLMLYQKYRDPKMIAPARARLDYILAHPAQSTLDWNSPGNQDRWSWSDALFMAPMGWLRMWEVTGEQRYLDFMNREWWATTERLYRPDIGLYFRDESFMDSRERNGKTIHWGRGTGWSVAGLAQVLEHFPKSHPDYPRYRAQFRQMAETFLATQQRDGLWRPGILDPQTHTARETSGSAFITFALAWGVNHQLLDARRFGPAVIRAWNSLNASVTPEGKLQDVQPIGAAPHGFAPTNYEPFATGAFLMAASEVIGMAKQ
ncbi:MAG: glycoside hydrolase family 105 protein, partial [Gammaproteobacteria bacterium]